MWSYCCAYSMVRCKKSQLCLLFPIVCDFRKVHEVKSYPLNFSQDLGFKVGKAVIMEEVPKGLSSEVWSSETLSMGGYAIAHQPSGLLVKSEEDNALIMEYQVARLME